MLCRCSEGRDLFFAAKSTFNLGGKDRRGGSVITIPTRGPDAELKTDDLKRLLTYLASLPR